MRLCLRGYRHKDDEERYQRRPERGMSHSGEDLAVAVKQEAEGVDHLVCADDVFGLDDTVISVRRMNI